MELMAWCSWALFTVDGCVEALLLFLLFDFCCP